MELSFEQTSFLRTRETGELENLVRLTFTAAHGNVRLYFDDTLIYSGSSSGVLSVEHWIPEPLCERKAAVILVADGVTTEETVALRVPKHCEIHLVQVSHHDPGYTDLMSHVLERHYEWIDQVLDEMELRDDYPEDTRLRITIEQFWSLDYYLSHAPAERVEKLIARVKRGDIELTALYANLITEQLGHEECYRALYPARRFAETCGVRLVTASHCDIPGISWGMCRALCDAGVKFLAADFPSYYSWGYSGLVSFWTPEKLYGYDGPGAFYWKSPDDKRLLLWNSHGSTPDGWEDSLIASAAEVMNDEAYPYDVFRVTVKSASMDNSRYSALYADKATAWNERYAFPHIVVSTNERFMERLIADAAERGVTIPEAEGDLPGQDYPVAAMSMAAVTSAARRTSNRLTAAEKLSVFAGDDPLFKSPERLLEKTWIDLLMSDDHAYGYQFPAGPAMRASYWEKGVYAMRAEACAQDIADKALASVADRIAPAGSELRLVVFNPCGKGMSRAVETAMREFDNCGTVQCPSNGNPKLERGYLLNNRRRVNPDSSFWKDGLFDLVDLQTGKKTPYVIDELSWDDPEYFAPESVGLGSGTPRYGFFEEPGGLKRILRFIAEDLPPFGYKTYALVPAEKSGAVSDSVPANGCIENGVYRVSCDRKGVCSIIDLRSGKELLDGGCPHRIGDVLVRTGRNPHAEAMKVCNIEIKQNELCGEIKLYAEIDGAYEVCVKFALWKGVDRIDTAVHLLRSAKPLQSMFMAFPFAGNGFRYEGALCELEPVKNGLPGIQSDFLAVRDYVRVAGSDILWSSRDTAVVALGELRPGYISPAHSCIMEGGRHEPLTEQDFRKSGCIYALLLANNFGTNFMCSQSFDGVYKFSFGVGPKADAASDALWGETEQNPVITQFTDRTRGELPAAQSLFDCGGLHCLTLKQSRDKTCYVARLWNHSPEPRRIELKIAGKTVAGIAVCDAVERETGEKTPDEIPGNTVLTLKIRVE